MRIIQTILIIMIMISCKSETDKLFRIEKNADHGNEFLNIVETRNILPIPADSMRKFLNWDEIKSTHLLESQIYSTDTVETKTVVFKNYGKIHKSENFQAYVLLRIGNDSLGRDYKFIIRTYSYDWDIIDNFDLAIWDEHNKYYCFGSINKNLIIERRCNDSEVAEIMEIIKNGKIILTSYHKP
jgi:hypothetical protein